MRHDEGGYKEVDLASKKKVVVASKKKSIDAHLPAGYLKKS